MILVSSSLISIAIPLVCDICTTYCGFFVSGSSLLTAPSASISVPFILPTAHSHTFFSDTPMHCATLVYTCCISTLTSADRSSVSTPRLLLLSLPERPQIHLKFLSGSNLEEYKHLTEYISCICSTVKCTINLMMGFECE